jgi:hypothetical protein
MKCGSITVRRRTAHAPGALVRENAMLDLKTQSQLMDATASIMRAYMRAATETMAAFRFGRRPCSLRAAETARAYIRLG